MTTAAVRESEILAVAARLFREKGYHATSMQDLAEAVGMQRGSFYYYIRTKEDLLFRVMRDAMEAFIQAVQPVVEQPGDPREKLRRAVTKHLKVLAQRIDAVAVLLHELKALSPARQQEIVALRDAYEGLIRRILAEGAEQGVFAVASPRLAGFVVLAVMNWPYQWYRPTGPARPEELAAAFAHILLRGLERRAGEGERV
ncbi:MAG TPA: TetR/AcrR family transcriptional regulator [Limnochordales bacterium]